MAASRPSRKPERCSAVRCASTGNQPMPARRRHVRVPRPGSYGVGRRPGLERGALRGACSPSGDVLRALRERLFTSWALFSSGGRAPKRALAREGAARDLYVPRRAPAAASKRGGLCASGSCGDPRPAALTQRWFREVTPLRGRGHPTQPESRLGPRDPPADVGGVDGGPHAGRLDAAAPALLELEQLEPPRAVSDNIRHALAQPSVCATTSVGPSNPPA